MFALRGVADLYLLRSERLPQVAHHAGQLLPVYEPIAVLGVTVFFLLKIQELFSHNLKQESFVFSADHPSKEGLD